MFGGSEDFENNSSEAGSQQKERKQMCESHFLRGFALSPLPVMVLQQTYCT
jgi:hypothetical protein